MKKLKLYIAPIIDLNGLFDFMFKGIWFSVALIKRNFNAKEEMQITKKIWKNIQVNYITS